MTIDASVVTRRQAVPYEMRSQRGMLCICISFACLFGGFQAAASLQTSLNGLLGSINMLSCYAAFTLFCLITPPVFQASEKRLRIGLIIMITMTPYICMVFINLAKVSDTPDAIWGLQIAFNTLVGVFGSLLWTAANSYISRCVNFSAKQLSEEGHGDLEAMQALSSVRYNCMFTGFMQFSGLIGCAFASVVLTSWSSDMAKMVLFILLGIVCSIGASILIALPMLPTSAGSTTVVPSLLDTLRLAAFDSRTRLIIPILVTNGMTLAFFLGEFQTDVTCRVAGSQFTGFLMAVFYTVNTMACTGWGRLVSHGFVSRRMAFIVSTICILAYLIAKAAWTVPNVFVFDVRSNLWVQSEQNNAGGTVSACALATIFALGDSFYEMGPPMVMQTFYNGTEQVVPAMASLKVWQGLGFTMQFVIAIVLKEIVLARDLILIVMLVVSISCVLILDKCVASIDPTRSVVAGDTSQPACEPAADVMSSI